MKLNIKTLTIEALKLILIVIVVTNLISFFKKPDIATKNLPNIPIKFINGQESSLVQFKDKPLILYFWGSWCPVCKISSPVINDLSKEYKVVTIAVNSGNDEELKKYMLEHDLQFPTVNDNDGKLAKIFGITTFPTTFTYNDEGKNIFVDSGYTSAVSLKFKLWLGKFL